ncbi:MAG: NAD(P)H-dependent oxidoreductase [Nitrospiraceae bacterium]|nr:NAD(P)H-dependent oxidoreductase [Nitrospiraceae bacterium]
MKTQRRVLLLVGSPGPQSTSLSLGSHLTGLLGQHGMETETLHITSCLRSPGAEETLLAAAGRADILILASPLYVDSLPGPVVAALRILAQQQGARRAGTRRRLLAIVNCGFPESHHNDTALAQVRLFCRDTGIEWSGGLGLGGGGMIAGRPLAQKGRAVRNVLASLALAACALAEDEPLPEHAVSLMARPLTPAWLYILVGHLGWLLQARRFGVLGRINDRPYSAASGGGRVALDGSEDIEE